MIQAGKFRHAITIYNPAADSSRDTFGGRKGKGAKVADVWAAKEDWGGDETTEGKRLTDVVTTKFKIRYRTGVDPSMTVELGSDVYNILSVLDFDGTKRELVLNCRKVQP